MGLSHPLISYFCWRAVTSSPLFACYLVGLSHPPLEGCHIPSTCCPWRACSVCSLSMQHLRNKPPQGNRLPGNLRERTPSSVHRIQRAQPSSATSSSSTSWVREGSSNSVPLSSAVLFTDNLGGNHSRPAPSREQKRLGSPTDRSLPHTKLPRVAPACSQEPFSFAPSQPSQEALNRIDGFASTKVRRVAQSQRVTSHSESIAADRPEARRIISLSDSLSGSVAPCPVQNVNQARKLRIPPSRVG